jgi:hypothetical protein
MRVFEMRGQALLDSFEEVSVLAERGEDVGVPESLFGGEGVGAEVDEL